jgi:hypothetical protein
MQTTNHSNNVAAWTLQRRCKGCFQHGKEEPFVSGGVPLLFVHLQRLHLFFEPNQGKFRAFSKGEFRD